MVKRLAPIYTKLGQEQRAKRKSAQKRVSLTPKRIRKALRKYGSGE